MPCRFLLQFHVLIEDVNRIRASALQHSNQVIEEVQGNPGWARVRDASTGLSYYWHFESGHVAWQLDDSDNDSGNEAKKETSTNAMLDSSRFKSVVDFAERISAELSRQAGAAQLASVAPVCQATIEAHAMQKILADVAAQTFSNEEKDVDGQVRGAVANQTSKKENADEPWLAAVSRLLQANAPQQGGAQPADGHFHEALQAGPAPTLPAPSAADVDEAGEVLEPSTALCGAKPQEESSDMETERSNERARQPVVDAEEWAPPLPAGELSEPAPGDESIHLRGSSLPDGIETLEDAYGRNGASSKRKQEASGDATATAINGGIRKKKKHKERKSVKRSSKGAARLIDRWQAVHEELQADADASPASSQDQTGEGVGRERRSRVKAAHEWTREQRRDGGDVQNANFAPVLGNWRDRVKAKATKEDAQALERTQL
jgi:hypothetical protein